MEEAEQAFKEEVAGDKIRARKGRFFLTETPLWVGIGIKVLALVLLDLWPQIGLWLPHTRYKQQGRWRLA